MFEFTPMRRILVRGADAAFAAAGLEVRRRPRDGTIAPPPLLNEPEDAVHVVRGGGDAAFPCPLAESVAYHGFGYGGAAWHPFIEAIRERLTDPARSYRGSSLEAYFEAWQPADAWEALAIDAGRAPSALERLPSYAFLLPWLSLTPRERARAAEGIIRSENRRHSGQTLSISDGYNQHGPVTERKGVIEYERLWRCHEWLARDGWDRRRGDATVTLLRRGTDRRYLVLHGHHRAAAAGAIGFDHIPARPGTPPFVDVEDVDYWPQVRRGVWTPEAARRYIDHLFDFEPATWAARRGLARGATSEARTNHGSP